MKPPIEGMNTIPFMADSPMMMGAFIALLSFQSKNPVAKAEFKEETGHDLDSILNARGFDRLIDEATGHQKDVIVAWADWVAVHCWGIAE